MCPIVFQVLYWCKFKPDDCLRKLSILQMKMEGYRTCPVSQMKHPWNWDWSPFLLISVLLISRSQPLSGPFINFFISILSSTLKISPSRLSLLLFFSMFYGLHLLSPLYFFFLSPFLPTLSSSFSFRQKNKSTRRLDMPNFRKQWHFREWGTGFWGED